MYRLSMLLALLCLGLATAAVADAWTLRNPTGASYTDEAVRLHLPAPTVPFTVKQDGTDIPYQLEEIDGARAIWVSASLGKTEAHTYTTEPGRPIKGTPKVTLTRDGNDYVLDNGLLAARVPAQATTLVPPLTAIRLADGTWVGKGYWNTALPMTRFTATIVGDGTVFAKVRLRYDFAGMAGIDNAVPAFALIDIALYPGQRHLVIEEGHAMARDDSWEFDLAAGWNARTPRCQVFGGGAGRADNPDALPKDLSPLGWDPAAIQQRYDTGDPRLGDTLMWLVPRANQHYEDGWLFSVSNGAQLAGAIPARAGKWTWPHDNKIAITAKPTADYAGLRCPTRRGTRYWYLIVGPTDAFAGGRAGNYARRYVYQGLDKILTDYITDWPEGVAKSGGNGFYAGGFDPLTLKRGYVRGGDWRGGNPMDTLTAVQAILDPDLYGEYWTYWSPTNPNFFTDFYKAAIWKLPDLKSHPRYADLARLGAMKVCEDVYHSIALPGGAGQECPGYMSYAMGSLRQLVKQSGAEAIDPDINERFAAGESFLRHISQPDGVGVRRFLPMGDTHPGKDGPNPITVAEDEVKQYQTEELPGFGVVFHNKPGTAQETYLAFKSGPNRGHYHGDQLAFHYGANAHPVVVDHHCSYGPRAGQEHMHNRLTFFTKEMPYANMDGYEHVIALKTSPDVDIAMGQVESERLRPMQPFPPEDWDRDYPQVQFAKPLQYRRTIVAVKNGPQDYFVIRDQYQADRQLGVAYCLHVLDNDTEALSVAVKTGGATVDKNGVLTDPTQDFTARGIQPGWYLLTGYKTRDRRYLIREVNGHTLRLEGMPEGTYNDYRILKDKLHMENGRIVLDTVTVFCATPGVKLASYPWSHTNGGLEATQGIRLETQGTAGEYITVLYPGKDAPQMTAIPGGVKVGDDTITFGGGIDAQQATTYVTVTRGGKAPMMLTGKEIDMNRFQGNIGLFVPDTGYPFGDIPDWLIKQRATPPAWYKPVLPLGYRP